MRNAEGVGVSRRVFQALLEVLLAEPLQLEDFLEQFEVFFLLMLEVPRETLVVELDVGQLALQILDEFQDVVLELVDLGKVALESVLLGKEEVFDLEEEIVDEKPGLGLRSGLLFGAEHGCNFPELFATFFILTAAPKKGGSFARFFSLEERLREAGKHTLRRRGAFKLGQLML